MVFHGTIPFGAPSQLRLQMSLDAEGAVFLTVLTPFDQPMGNLHEMRISLDDLRAIATDQSERVLARSDNATLEITRGTDQAHEFLHVHYVDPEKWTDSHSTVTIEDLTALVNEIGGAGGGGGAVAQAASAGPSGPLAGVGKVMAVLGVSNVEASLAFYCDKLGFTDSWTFGAPTNYGGATVGDFEVHLRRVENVSPGSGLSLYLQVEGVDALYERFVSSGVRIVDELGLRPYKMRDFTIADPDGLEIGFGQPAG